MITVNVDTTGLLRLEAQVKDMGKQVRFATERALNAAAYETSRATSKEMARVFDRPTSWVLRSVRYVKANRKTQTEMSVSVDFDYWGNKQGVTVSQVLRAQIYGGQRRLKRHEVALQRIGVLPYGMFIVPGQAAQLDSNGNMSAGQINQIMSWFRAFGEQGYQANMTQATQDKRRKGTRKSYGFEYFVVKPGAVRTWFRGTNEARGRHKMQPGIYMRTFMGFGDAIRPVMIFVHFARYRQRLDFYGLAERTARAEFAAKFPQYLADALRTAR